MTQPPGASVILRGYIPGLNGLRAGAVLMVMIGHAGFPNVVPGGLGVTIFFFISGFLITSLLLQEQRSTGAISVANFYVRRFLRLGPELLAFLLCSSALGILYMGAAGRLPNVIDWLGALAYVTNYVHLLLFDGGDGLRWPHLWSLAVEEHFYLTFPLAFSLLCLRRTFALAALSCICLWGLAWRITIFAAGFPQNWYYEASDARLDSIAFGCLTACLFAWKAQYVNLRGAGSTMALLAGIALMLLSLLIRDELYRETARFTLQGLAMGLLTVGLYTSRLGSLLVGLMEWTPIRWMGQMSYGAYLWHFDVIVAGSHFSGIAQEDRPIGQRLLLALTYAATSFAVAYVSYRSLYVPFLGTRRRFGSRSNTSPVAELSKPSSDARPFHTPSPAHAPDAPAAEPASCATERRSL
jgi:peptidoglycan/LPS O-acetylase OafA/YrhL